ncbi:type II toxin-antitoxin system HicB family antitoxin [Selenomonas sp.]|uniref:type II toxin-antitoxin system HicB family antitoxin n=1 Tax=Selenomonas sp. TaxID=2053611 RepID=UPI0025EB5402|nr:type II toxin-antitoxin system HicB family antitoxin [Selenomonas sp.]MCI6085567.1 type II toxin-antitoxin system HicB family antitoxin [Selenomonas sp.]MCI6283575.1 type II toxin-antitoxin system HicB family antitoxin [Selenomonas sp.]MDY3296305.1 type II toxin-antitoxin system HicB family antitoxin [Selenomonas sp.]MDY4417522.1 type II toxin-antitoxin system HicB family antitoxin [Selenomonas sp.]
MKYLYPAIFTKEEDGIIVSFPDVDGAFTDGATMAEAYENAEDVLNLMLMSYEDDREPILPPTDLDKLEIPAHSIAALVAADTDAYRRKVDTKAIHKNVSIPSWLNTLAIKRNVNFSNVLQNALMKELGVSSA